MTYLAPRQGLFAIIILISFCLQTLLLVLSTEQQLEKSREQKGEQMVAQLINESSLALQNRDRVSLSVIAGRYTSEADVARLVMKDAKDQDLVQLGNAPMHQGETIRQVATKGDAVIGSVALTLKDTSKGEIIASLWPFVIGSMLLHLFLWLLYGYVARPTRDQINALSRDIHEYYRQKYQPVPSAHSRHTEEDMAESELETDRPSISQVLPSPNAVHSDQAANDVSAPKKRWSLFQKSAPDTSAAQDIDSADQAAAQPVDIHQELNAYLKSQQAQPEEGADTTESALASAALNKTAHATETTASAASAAPNTATTNTDTTRSHASNTSQGASSMPTSMPASLTAQRNVEVVDVQIIYDDHYRLLDKLAPEAAEPYFMLCSQLLNQAITELLKQPLLYGITLHNEPKFDHSGSLVVLKADNSHSKVALAGVMLGKLYLMLNQIIYDKHRELSRFALPVKVGVSDEMLSRPLAQLLQTVGRRNEMIILYPKSGLKQIGNHVQVRSLPRPTTVYERESAFFDGSNEAMMQRLIEVRNAVLLSGNAAS